MISTLVSPAAKNGFKSVISIFCCSVSVGNISLHFQTFILSLIVIIQWDVWDLIWSSSVCLESHEESEQTETKSRRTVSQDASRNLLQSSWETLLKHTHTHTHTHTHSHTHRSRRTVSQDASRNLLQSSWETLLKHTHTHTHSHTQIQKNCEDASRNLLQSSWETLLKHTHTHTLTHTHTHTDPEELWRRFKKPPAKLLRNSAQEHRGQNLL